MPESGLAKTYKNLVRIKDIVKVLTKHGFGHLVVRLNLAKYVPVLDRISALPKAADEEVVEESPAVRLRLVLEELGPSFIKLGQLLSTRPDLISEPFSGEFRKLQDRVAPFDAGTAKEILETELGKKSEELFKSFGEEPSASGSIGQVHQVELLDGTRAVVKIRRPGIEKTVEADIALLSTLADLVERHLPEYRIYRPKMIVEEFARSLKKEIDFIVEASFTQKFFDRFISDKQIKTPKVYWDYTSHTVLTIEKIEGRKLRNVLRDGEPAAARHALAERFGAAFLKQFFEFGIFHADPHPGNVFVLPDGRIGLIDFGNVAHLSGELKDQLTRSLIALADGDLETIIDVYADIGVFTERAGERDLKPDLLDLLDRYYGVPAKFLDFGAIFCDVVALARKHRMTLPRDFVLLGRSFVIVATVAASLDENFSFEKVIKPYLKPLLRDKLSPTGLFKKASLNMLNIGSFLFHLPKDLKNIIRKMRTGNLRLTFKHEGLEDFMYELDKASNRLAFSVVIAAIIIGSSIMMTMQWGRIGNVPIIGILGYLIAGVLGLWLIWAILRSGRL